MARASVETACEGFDAVAVGVVELREGVGEGEEGEGDREEGEEEEEEGVGAGFAVRLWGGERVLLVWGVLNGCGGGTGG